MRVNCSFSTRPALRRAVIAARNAGLFIFRQLPIHRTREFSLNPQSILMSLPVFAMLMIGGCPDKHPHPTFIRTGVTAPPHVVRRDADTARLRWIPLTFRNGQ